MALSIVPGNEIRSRYIEGAQSRCRRTVGRHGYVGISENALRGGSGRKKEEKKTIEQARGRCEREDCSGGGARVFCAQELHGLIAECNTDEGVKALDTRGIAGRSRFFGGRVPDAVVQHPLQLPVRLRCSRWSDFCRCKTLFANSRSSNRSVHGHDATRGTRVQLRPATPHCVLGQHFFLLRRCSQGARGYLTHSGSRFSLVTRSSLLRN